MFDSKKLAYKLSEVAIGRMRIRDFEDWFVPASWNANLWASPQLRDAIYSIELAIAEHSNRHVDGSYLRAFTGEIAGQLEPLMDDILPAPIADCLHTAEIEQAAVVAGRLRAAA